MRLPRADSLVRFVYCMLPLALFFCVAGTVSPHQSRVTIIRPVENANFKAVDDPKCISTAVEAGDPSSGPSTVQTKAALCDGMFLARSGNSW